MTAQIIPFDDLETGPNWRTQPGVYVGQAEGMQHCISSLTPITARD